MRYLIIRHKIRRTLLFILLVIVFVSFAPQLYRNIFIHDEDFIVQDEGPEQYDFSNRLIGSVLDKDVSLDLHFLNGHHILSEVNIEDLELAGIRLSMDAIVKGQLIMDGKKAIGFSGRVFSRNTSLNSNPFLDMRMSFKIIDDELKIESLHLGKSYNLKGKMNLVEPFQTDLQIEITRADIKDLAIMAKVKPAPEFMFGVMNGRFNFKGPLTNLFSNGILESKNGTLGPIVYDFATMRFEGFGPIMNIVDSNVRQGNGSMQLEGYIDLRNIGKGDLLTGLRVNKSDMKTIVWRDWDITKNDTDELSMSKDINDKMRIGFKTMARDSLTTYYEKENPEEMSLQYKMGGLENLKMKLKENEEFFGVEHSVKF